MKALLTAALVLSAAPMIAQQTGVSHPDPTPITADDLDAQPAQQPAPQAARKPSAAIPYTAPAPSVSDDANVVTTDAAPVSQAPVHAAATRSTATLTPRGAAVSPPLDIDRDVVTSVPERPGEVPEGTLLRVRMNDSVSTLSTQQGSAFTATVTEDILNDGRTVVPAGSILDGMVTEVRGGRRISGRAAIHLEPRRVTLPDGTYYVLHAQVIDASDNNDVRVNREGTILRRDHAKETIAILSATTGSAAVAGAMMAGGVGAAVGAGIGAGAGTILWLKQDRQAALPKDTSLIFSLTTPMATRPLQDGAVLRH
ncbi:MAG TPA: hypothetical protein VGC07_07075 [Granulicella sp.]